jgi:RNA polymerase sigma-70 factor (ECF subfamily)
MREGQGFCTLDNPRAWLFRVARNAAIDRQRLAKPHEPLDAQPENLPEPAPDDAAPVDALASCLERVMGELSHDDAEVLRACDIEGRTLKTFAQQRKLSLPAVKSRLLRARQRLRERMITACRVQFDVDTGSVTGHLGRSGEGKPGGC